MKSPTDLTRPQVITDAHPDDEGTGIYWLIDENGKQEQILLKKQFPTLGKSVLACAPRRGSRANPPPWWSWG